MLYGRINFQIKKPLQLFLSLLNSTMSTLLQSIWIFAICTLSQDVKLWQNYSNVCGDAISKPKQDNTYVKYFGDHSSYQECEKACIDYTKRNPKQRCESYTYFEKTTTDKENSMACYGRINDPQFCPCKNNSVIAAEIYWPCQSDMDCSLNGKCENKTGKRLFYDI